MRTLRAGEGEGVGCGVAEANGIGAGIGVIDSCASIGVTTHSRESAAIIPVISSERERSGVQSRNLLLFRISPPNIKRCLGPSRTGIFARHDKDFVRHDTSEVIAPIQARKNIIAPLAFGEKILVHFSTDELLV